MEKIFDIAKDSEQKWGVIAQGIDGNFEETDLELDNKLSEKIDRDSFIISDNNGYIIAIVDKDGVHSIDYKIKDDSLNDILYGINIAIKNKASKDELNEERIRATGEEGKKLNKVIDDDKFIITDKNGYIVARIDKNGVKSVAENTNNAIVCMVLSENYYPTEAPTRDEDGNVTFAKVIYGTGESGTITISYINKNASSMSIVYGNKTVLASIDRDENGNVIKLTFN